MTASLDLGGTCRACPPEETLARVAPLFERIGITRVADVTGLDSLGIPVAVCIRPSARNISVAQGKGVTVALARASAVMESVELWHAEQTRPADVVAPFTDVAAEAVDPTDLEPGFAFGRWRPDRPLGWLRARDLGGGGAVLVPRCVVDLDTTAAGGDRGLLNASSNGLASGNTGAEAELHALCELVERDEVARFARLPSAERAQRRLDLGTVEAPVVADVLDRMRGERAVEVDAWDITLGTGIPVFRATVTERDSWRALGCFVGTGCHPVPAIALARALTEAAQSRLTVITGSRDDVFPSFYRAAGPRLPPGPARPGPLAFRPGRRGAGSIEEHRDEVVQRLVRSGRGRVAVVDHTSPDLGVPVVHAVVPGLRFQPAA